MAFEQENVRIKELTLAKINKKIHSFCWESQLKTGYELFFGITHISKGG